MLRFNRATSSEPRKAGTLIVLYIRLPLEPHLGAFMYKRIISITPLQYV